MSSNVVADVEQESCAEELLLCDGEVRLATPSEILFLTVLGIDLLSPLPFSRLEDPALPYVATGALLVTLGLDRFEDGGVIRLLDVVAATCALLIRLGPAIVQST